MLARLEMSIQSDAKFNYNMGSVFQGLLMEIIVPQYIEVLHSKAILPYSQFIITNRNNNEIKWIVATMNQESYQNIIKPLLNIIDNDEELIIKNKNIKFKISGYTIEKATYEDIVKKCYLNSEIQRVKRLQFITPCSFKSGGEYQILPSIKWIFQSLMKKFDAYSDVAKVFDKEALEHIEKYVKFSRYKLHSTVFHIEKVKIQAFIGNIEFYVKGSNTMINLIDLLIEFSKFSGVGIKTAMGMGGIYEGK